MGRKNNGLNYFSKRKENMEKAQEIVQWEERNCKEEIKDLVKRTELIQDTGTMHSGPCKFEQPEVEVVQCSTVDAIMAEYAKGNRVCALNFASYKNPGGMFLEGSMAQEESLCHASLLYPVLSSTQVRTIFYDRHQGNLNKALYRSDMLYTPDIPFWQHGEEAKASIITCAAPNKKAAQKYQGVPDAVCKEAMEERIAAVLNAAHSKGEEVLILGAFGCGVFGNDVREVAEIFRDELNLLFYGTFRRIVFAVLDEPSCKIMKEVLIH